MHVGCQIRNRGRVLVFFFSFLFFSKVISWDERNTAVKQVLETPEERQKNFPILFLFAT